MTNELWYFLINGQADNETGLYGNFYAYGKHLGDALECAFSEAKRQRFNNPTLIEAFKLNTMEELECPEELIQLSDTVYMRETTFPFSFNDPDKEFQPPVGIVKATGEDEYDYDLIAENFVAYEKNEEGIFEFEMNVGKAKIKEIFITTINLLSSVDAFWIYIQSFWESGKTELWVAKKLDRKESIINFLKSQEENTIQNGYIKVVIHSLNGETNLILDDHKKIQLFTKSKDVFDNFIEKIIGLGYKQCSEFYNLQYGFHHWHYRPYNSLGRDNFKVMLQESDFDLLDSWEE